MRHDEPWRHMVDGMSVPGGDGYVVPSRRVIKTSRDAPHLAIILPVGPKDEYDIAVCEHCHRRTRVRPGQAYRGPGLVPLELMVNHMHVATPLNVSVSFYTLKNHISAVLRESMTNQALAAGANYLFYWDDDVILPADVLYRMMIQMAKNPDVGLITGVYFTKRLPSEPVLYKYPGQGAYWGFSVDPNAPLEDVYACGAGCMMVRADALRKLEPPYWQDERHTSEDGSKASVLGHDIRFCRRILEGTGYRVTVDGSVQCLHLDARAGKAYGLPPDSPPGEMARRIAEEERATDVPPSDVVDGHEVERVMALEAGGDET